ncbi:hypothetical protein Daus18300_004840 [Diaporthe australafricana]|uniref:Uncharacterized protein n=1 Tax=Diaporthe australafricana TaxID=127596 RepID=A0ABR3X628_9PEZI
MARYMGGPRGRSRPRSSIAPPTSSDYDTSGSDDDQQEAIAAQEETVIPDSDDPASSSQVCLLSASSLLSLTDDRFWKDGQSDVAPQHPEDQFDSDSAMEDDAEELEGESAQDIPNDSNYEGSNESNAIAATTDQSARDNDEDAVNEEESQSPVVRPKRQRSLSIEIHYRSRFSPNRPVYQPQPLPIAYGWMAKGVQDHVEDLHLHGIPVCHSVESKKKIQVLGEYTWIKFTPSQDRTYEKYPAVYVPGNSRTWQGLMLDTSLPKAAVGHDSSQAVHDDSYNRQSRYPYEPTFRALEYTQPDNSFKHVDIVTDVNTLTKLHAFIIGISSGVPKGESFRLDLFSVRDTLFLLPSQKPGSSQVGPDPKKLRRDLKSEVPHWCADVIGHIGTSSPKLPYSGNHYRVVRYRFGDVVVAVRVKVDIVYEHRKDAKRANVDPLRDVQPVFWPKQDTDVAQVWKTTVKEQGLGTKPAGAGIVSVRYTWEDKMRKLKAMFPHVWFSRTPFVIDCEVNSPDLEIKGASLINSRNFFTSFEQGWQHSLRRLAGLLGYLQRRTRELGGNLILIADPDQICFVLCTPVVKRPALPEDLAMKFWGPDTEAAARDRRAEKTPESDESELTPVSQTPSLPEGSDIATVGMSQPNNSQAGMEAISDCVTVRGGRSPTRAERQRKQGIDPAKMVQDWKTSVKKKKKRAQKPANVDGAGYDSDDEDTPDHDRAESFDAGGSSGEDSIMVGESAHESGIENADPAMNRLMLQMNPREGSEQEHGNVEGEVGRSFTGRGRVSQREDFSQEPVHIDQISSVLRRDDVEILRGQHSLLMVPRNESRSHDAEARRSIGPNHQQQGFDDTVFPSAPTPPGPSDFDEEGKLIDRRASNRDQFEADSDDGNEAPPPRRVSDNYHPTVTVRRPRVKYTGPASRPSRPRVPPNRTLWQRPSPVQAEVVEVEDDSLSSSVDEYDDDVDDDAEEPGTIHVADSDSDQGSAAADGVPGGGQGNRSQSRDSNE